MTLGLRVDGSSGPPKAPPRDAQLGRDKQQQPQPGRPMYGNDPRGGAGRPRPERHDATYGGRRQERQQRDVERSNPSIHVGPSPNPTNSDY